MYFTRDIAPRHDLRLAMLENWKELVTKERDGAMEQVAARHREVEQACNMALPQQMVRIGIAGMLAPFNIVGANIQGSKNEGGLIAPLVRGSIGISFADIEKHGIGGGSCSLINKPFGC